MKDGVTGINVAQKGISESLTQLRGENE